MRHLHCPQKPVHNVFYPVIKRYPMVESQTPIGFAGATSQAGEGLAGVILYVLIIWP